MTTNQSPIYDTNVSETDKKNFDIVLRAAHNMDLCIVRTKRKDNGRVVTIICAASVNQDGQDDEDGGKNGTITFLPVAELVSGNPLDLYEEPLTFIDQDRN